MKSFLICLFISSSSLLFSQPPSSFKYQGIARNSNGNPVSSQPISIRISIHAGNPTGPVLYRETHNTTTNAFGNFNINLGGGIVNTGVFSTIAWGRSTYFQEVEMDIAGGSSFVSMGTSQYLSVPYALAADSARDGIAPFVVENTIQGNDINAIALGAIANTEPNSAPVMYVKNNGNGTVIYAESGNGVFILGDSTGFETNGESILGGKVRIDDSLRVSAPLTVTGNTSLQNHLSVGGTSTLSILSATQGNFTGNLTTTGVTANGNVQVNGNLGVTGSLGPISASLVNGTQGNFSVSVTTPSLTVNGTGHVFGNLQVDGNLSKGGGSFKIDHPLYPADKFLYHSFVESPDMKNIYDGTVTTDAAGYALVALPEYFEALNSDFRYQLTTIGQFAQAIVFKEISKNKFTIKTDKPNVKISWQVTGIRKDTYAEQYRIVPEVEKSDKEKGKLLYPVN